MVPTDYDICPVVFVWLVAAVDLDEVFGVSQTSAYEGGGAKSFFEVVSPPVKDK